MHSRGVILGTMSVLFMLKMCNCSTVLDRFLEILYHMLIREQRIYIRVWSIMGVSLLH